MKHSKAFTLIEAMISMIALTIALGLIFSAFLAVMQIFTSEMSDTDVSMSSHKPIEMMAGELRGALEIISTSTESVSFWYKDLNSDSTREASETVTYTWLPTREAIFRSVSTSTVRIASNITNMNLTYSGTPVTQITIKVTARLGTSINTLESSVKCRNL